MFAVKKMLAGIVLWGLCLMAAACSPGTDDGGSAVPESGSSGAPAAKAEKTDVVLVVLNGLRAPSMELYGNAEDPTPFLSSLENDSVIFDYCLANGFWFYSSMPSLLTGLYPAHHGSTLVRNDDDYFDQLPEDRVTLPEVFSRAGYRTALYSALNYYDQDLGLLQGFDETVTFADIVDGTATEQLPTIGRELRENEAVIIDRALEGATGGNTPAFSLVHLNAAMSPLGVPEEAIGEFVTQEEFDGFVEKYGPAFGYGTNQHEIVRQDAEFVDFTRRLYLESLRYTDDLVRRLVTRYQQQRPETLFVFTSEHGQLFMEKDAGHLFGDQVIPYDLLTRVPLIFHQPGTLQPRRVQVNAMLADLKPTFAELFGVRDQGLRDGSSLAGVIRGGIPEPALRDRSLFAHSGNIFQTYAVVQGNYKFMKLVPTSEASLWLTTRAPNAEMLFLKGGQESVNLLYSHPEKGRTMRNEANAILTEGHGRHLVFIGDGEPRRYAGSVTSDSNVDRAIIRYHNNEASLDIGLASSANYTSRLPLNFDTASSVTSATGNRYDLILAPGDEVTATFQTGEIAGLQTGKPFALTVGFIHEATPGQSLRVQYRTPRYWNSNTVKGQGEASWYGINYMALVGQALELALTNESESPIKIRNLCAMPTEAAARSFGRSEGSLYHDFQLAEGMVDLNWQHTGKPEEWTFVAEHPDVVPLHVWSNGRFTRVEGNQLTAADSVAAPLAQAGEISQALRRASDENQPGIYYYAVGEPNNSHSRP